MSVNLPHCQNKGGAGGQFKLKRIDSISKYSLLKLRYTLKTLKTLSILKTLMNFYSHICG